MEDIIYGWHFLSTHGTAYGGYRPPAVGAWEPPIENPEPCVRGYHGSPTVLKALRYAPGPILGRCEYRGVVWHGDGTKWAARERRCIARVDASAWLRFAACHFAEEALSMAGVTDKRSHNAVAVARRFALGLATANEMGFVGGAAYAVAYANPVHIARAAYAAAFAAGHSAEGAAYAAALHSVLLAKATERWLESAALDLDCAPECAHV
mgnify:CR=1 FL=1